MEGKKRTQPEHVGLSKQCPTALEMLALSVVHCTTFKQARAKRKKQIFFAAWKTDTFGDLFPCWENAKKRTMQCIGENIHQIGWVLQSFDAYAMHLAATPLRECMMACLHPKQLLSLPMYLSAGNLLQCTVGGTETVLPVQCAHVCTSIAPTDL